MDQKIIKEKIKFFRQKNHLTQHSMACLMGITQSFYQKIEAGDSSIQLVDFIKICSIFKISLDEFVYCEIIISQYSTIYTSEASNKPIKNESVTNGQAALLQMFHYIKEQELILKAMIANSNNVNNNGNYFR